MNLKLSKNEIFALKKFCQKEMGTGRLAEELGKKQSYASRIAKTLERKGLLSKAGARNYALSPASHAQSFKALHQSRPLAGIEDWLSGCCLPILVLCAWRKEGAPPQIFWKEVPCSKPSAYKALQKLTGAGVLAKDAASIRVVDGLAGSFANCYADNMARIAEEKIEGASMSARVRAHVIVRCKKAPHPFLPSGMDVLEQNGLEALRTSDRDYYLRLDGKAKPVSLEEAFVHALLLSTRLSYGDRKVLGIFLFKSRSRMKNQMLRELAREYGVEGEFQEMRRSLDYAEGIQ